MENFNVNEKRFISAVEKALDVAAKKLPDDVVARLSEMRDSETSLSAKAFYDCYFENMDKATELSRPICQDTGVVNFYVKVGTHFPLIDSLEALLVKAVERATQSVPLRHNAVETFVEKNTGTNLGTKVPYIEWEVVPHSSELELTIYLAGGGSSLPGRATVMVPSAGYEAITEFVLDTMVNYGINACPPLVVGVGVGPCVASSARLAKKATLRTLGSRNSSEVVAKEEQKLFDTLNKIGIGPQGLGGRESVMAVHIENMARHPSSFGVAVAFGCWAHRRMTLKISDTLDFKVTTHKGVTL
ncbi:MAG: L(+)-tartrate dehydratase subunit alpha [Clostridia bacterium]|nr:L(+)-tartrate dehydratase subunit alpha [Clostridia bacterium]